MLVYQRVSFVSFRNRSTKSIPKVQMWCMKRLQLTRWWRRTAGFPHQWTMVWYSGKWSEFLGRIIFMFVWFYIIIMKYMNYVFYELYANSWLPGRNAVVFSCFGACCWSTDDLSTACFSLWCVCCLVGGLLYRSPGATTHTWSDCFSALTRGLWNRSTCILLKNNGSLDKTYTKKAAPGNSFKQKEHSIWWQNHAKRMGVSFDFP